MAGLYYKEPQKVNPADFVRASMSIPLFFQPWRITGLPKGQEYLWKKQALYYGPIPDEVLLVDGGTLSNFAIDVFHRTNIVPTRPTFGVKLGLERNQPHIIDQCHELVIGCFSAACQRRDLEFILNHPDYNHLVALVDVGEHDWMNFNLSDNAKIHLFVRGARTASAFLKNFQWEKYKKIREGMMSEKVIDIWKFADAGMAKSY